MESVPSDLIRLNDVAREFPDGSRPHLSSIFRWTTKGCRGVRLPVVRVGGKTFISRQALLDFVAALSTQRRREHVAPPTTTTRTRAARREAARRRLDDAGIK